MLLVVKLGDDFEMGLIIAGDQLQIDGRGSRRGAVLAGQHQVLDLLAPGVSLTRAKLRDALGVKNERLGEALESLERAGRLRRTPSGWQRCG